MFPRNLQLLTLFVRLLPLTVSGVEISVSPSSMNEGATLTITCREQSLPQGNLLVRLALEKASDAGTYRSVLAYHLNIGPRDPYLPTWGSTTGAIQQRSNVTMSFEPSKTSGSFELRLHSVRCNDSALFRCARSAQGGAGMQSSAAQNVSIHGVTHNVQITGGQSCTSPTDPNCVRCQNFDNQVGSQPKYAKMGEPLVLTCAGQLATPSSQVRVTWYKQSLNDPDRSAITVNTTALVYDPPSPNACTVYGRSTLTYYPQDTDRQLRVSCEVSQQGSNDTVTKEISICVPDGTDRQTPPEPVTAIEISVSPPSLNEGATLTITCTQRPLPSGTILFTLGLEKANDVGGHDIVLVYHINPGPGDPYKLSLGSDIRQRANVTASFAGTRTSGAFELRIHSVRCSDSASFRCTSTTFGSSAGINASSLHNVSIDGVTHNVQITGGQECTSPTDPNCVRCQNFDDQVGSQPKYAKMGEPLVLTCAGQLATPSSQVRVTWYKQSLNDPDRSAITVNTTALVYDPPSPNACTVYGRSTLTYYPQDTDRQLRISCEVSQQGSNDTVTKEISICVPGLIFVPNTTWTDVTTVEPVVKDCSSTCQQRENRAAGPQRYGVEDIAGAVLGGAFGGALLALLLTFTILRCTGYTLTGSVKRKERHTGVALGNIHEF